MNEARLKEVLGKGNAIASKRIGSSFTLYRPVAADSVITPTNIIADPFYVGIAEHAASFKFGRPYAHNNHYNNGLLDTRVAQRFDYLVSTERGNWFVAGVEPISPCLLVRCDRVVTIKRSASAVPCGAVGVGGYGGVTAGSEIALMQGWPAALYEVGGKARSLAGLPIDVGAPTVEIMMPAWPDTIIRPSDSVSDDLGRRFVIKGAELTEFGWKLVAAEAVA